MKALISEVDTDVEKKCAADGLKAIMEAQPVDPKPIDDGYTEPAEPVIAKGFIKKVFGSDLAAEIPMARRPYNKKKDAKNNM